MKKAIQCKQCSAVIPWPYDSDKQYCSVKCSGLSKRKDYGMRPCELCGTSFTLTPKTKDRRFCSNKCAMFSLRKDYSGQKYSKLTFIRATDNRNSDNKILWELQCDCGGSKCALPGSVISGSITNCGCMPKTKDWAGKRVQERSKLTFIRPTDKRENKCIVWEALCDCGNTTFLVPRQDAISCGCAWRMYSPEISTARAVWGKTYKDADISFDLFHSMSQQNCDYCDAPPGRSYNREKARGKRKVKDKQKHQELLQTATFTYNGLDRVDSSKGHTVDNVVPCCWRCNRMKMDMTHAEFHAHISRIHTHAVRLGRIRIPTVVAPPSLS